MPLNAGRLLNAKSHLIGSRNQRTEVVLALPLRLTRLKPFRDISYELFGLLFLQTWSLHQFATCALSGFHLHSLYRDRSFVAAWKGLVVTGGNTGVVFAVIRFRYGTGATIYMESRSRLSPYGCFTRFTGFAYLRSRRKLRRRYNPSKKRCSFPKHEQSYCSFNFGLTIFYPSKQAFLLISLHA